MSSAPPPEFVSTPCPRCGRPLQDGACPACLLAEADPFELVEELGRGGMGVVWRARDRRLDRTVALKFLAEELAGQPGFAERLTREARLLARLEHPGIVRLYGTGESEGLPYLVMELVEGRPLSALLPLAPERVVELGAALLEALDFAHARGVVHLDLKPSNILVDAAGRPHIADFGVARLAGVQTQQGLAGTPAYLAPEALGGAAPDARMDLYALGVVLHQALSDRLPLGAFDPTGTALDRVIARALAPVERRYRDAAEMRRELLAVRAAVEAGDDLPPEERWLGRGVALVCTAATGVGLWALLRSLTPREVLPHELNPLVATGLLAGADGRLYSPARFEAGAILGAVAAAGAAAAAWALLFRHWRREGWLRRAPDRPLAASRPLFALGAFACLSAGARAAWGGELGAAQAFVPIFGGLVELACLVLFWLGVVEAARTGRALRQEPGLLLGMALAMLPPTGHLLAVVGG